MATKANYPYHGGQPKQGAGAGANAGGKLINTTKPSGGRKMNGASPKANQPETPPVKMHR
jgi:hypothetical protein